MKTIRILVLNGPNLNLLGTREPEIYGSGSYSDLELEIKSLADELKINCEIFQSNHEGVLIDKVQENIGKIDGLVINPAAYTHTSIALRDAVACLSNVLKVEVHLSDISKREEFRRHSYFSDLMDKVVVGQGREGYFVALRYLAECFIKGSSI